MLSTDFQIYAKIDGDLASRNQTDESTEWHCPLAVELETIKLTDRSPPHTHTHYIFFSRVSKLNHADTR